MKMWIIVLTLIQANGEYTTYEIPASPVYVRTETDCMKVARKIMGDFSDIWGAKPSDAYCKPY